MKAKKVYEFKRTRKQGLSKQTELGITMLKKEEIEKWFKENLPDVDYMINPDLSITIFDDLNGTNITELPDNLNVNGDVDFYDSNITELPDNLEIDGYLDLSFSNIKKLPDNLYVSGSLDLRNTPITELPEGLYVGGNLDLSNTSIKKLPDDLTVDKQIFKDF